MENLVKKQIVVFGGCFNPPLNSHFSLAEQLLAEYHQIEKIIFMPDSASMYARCLKCTPSPGAPSGTSAMVSLQVPPLVQIYGTSLWSRPPCFFGVVRADGPVEKWNQSQPAAGKID